MKKLILSSLMLIACSNSALLEGLESIETDKGELGNIVFENQANEAALINKLESEAATTTDPDKKSLIEQKIAQLKLNNLDQIVSTEVYEALENTLNSNIGDEALINELEKGVGNSISKDALTKLADGTLTPPPATPYKIWDEASKTLKDPTPSRKYNNQTEYERIESQIASLKYSLEQATDDTSKDNLNKRIRELEETKSKMVPSILPEEEKDELLLGDPLIKKLAGEILDEVTKIEDEYDDDYLLGLDDLFNERNPKRRALIKYISKFKGLKNKVIAYSIFKYNNALKVVKAKKRGK